MNPEGDTGIDIAGRRRAGRDLTGATPAASEPGAPEPLAPGELSRATAPVVLEHLDRLAELWPRHERHRPHVRKILGHLEQYPGETWTDRWMLFESEVGADGVAWRREVVPGGGTSPLESLNAAMGPLLALDVLRPSYPWMVAQNFKFLRALSVFRDAERTAQLERSLAERALPERHAQEAVLTLARIQAHTGKSVGAITAADILAMVNALPARSLDFSRSGLNAVWPVLHQLGWIEHSSTAMPSRRRRGQLTPEAMVASYGVPERFHDPLVRYLRIRSATLDYVSLRTLASNLVGTFWAEVCRRYPDVTDFALTQEQSDWWKASVRIKQDGTPRKGIHAVLFMTRAFYLDVAQWALEDAYWAAWAAPSPIAYAETRGYSKVKRAQVAQQHERTRGLSAVQPRLVEAAERELRDAEARLAAATDAGVGGQVLIDGAAWTVWQRKPRTPLRARRGGQDRDLVAEEDNAFWTWAIIETLRHSGLRIEELLELVHMNIQPYKVPASGETIPLLHVNPSKTDRERLLVAGPELVHVLYRVLSRVLDGKASVPLTQRWDHHEKTLGPPLPHLFVRRFGASPYRTIAVTTVANLLAGLAARAGIEVGGREVRFTPHDFRRIFATDALASGLPPHIVQVLLGHQNLATTQGYAAVYPKDVIRHHQTFIAQRRQTRPSEEYREPTAAEWDEFEAHFVQRKLSLGSCGRAFGTACSHEHACLRCALMRPDPREADRLRDIMDNLVSRIAEAEEHGWFGDAEGLRLTLAGAEQKLGQMERQRAREGEAPVLLGLPRTRGGA